MPEDKEAFERKNFRWRYQPRNQMDVLLLKYISSSDVRSTTEMMLLALRAFWLPFAIAQSADISETAKERILTEACCTLLNQLNQIYAVSGFSLPNYLVQTGSAKTSNNGQSKAANSPSIEEQKQAIGQFNYETDSFSNW
jgi:hypothetical protein